MHVRVVHELHTARGTDAGCELRAEACHVLLERDARQSGDADLTLSNRGKRSCTHPSPTHEGPLQAARYCATRPLQESVRVEARVARSVVGLPHVTKA